MNVLLGALGFEPVKSTRGGRSPLHERYEVLLREAGHDESNPVLDR
jgi:hypothetical protein